MTALRRRTALFAAIVTTTLTMGLPTAIFAAPLRFAAGRVWLEVPSPSNFDGDVALGDVNGDGKADLVTYAQHRGQAHVSLAVAGAFAPPKLWASGLPINPQGTYPFSLADVNGDRKADLIVFIHGDGQAPGSARVFVALSDGAVFRYGPSPVWNEGFCITEQSCALADVNGDGKADLIAFTQNFGLVWISLSTGTAFGTSAVWNKYFCIRGEMCASGDVDGDRKADLIAFKPNAPGNQKGNVLVSASTGTQFGAPRYGHGYFCIDNESCLVGDFNNDRRADVLLVKGLTGNRAQPGEVLVSLSNGNQFINPAPFKWGDVWMQPDSGGWAGFFVGDVTGDGRDDLVQMAIIGVVVAGGGSRTVKRQYVVYEVTDRPDTTPSGGPMPDATTSAGHEQVEIYNCTPDQHPLTYWIANVTTGETRQSAPTDAMYSEAGGCPDPDDEPYSIDLTSGQVYEIVAVDPPAVGCEGRNDPTIVACARFRFAARGAANGGTLRVILPGGVLTTMSTKLPTPGGAPSSNPATLPVTLERLAAVGLDYSVSRAEIQSWLGNKFARYRQFGQGVINLLSSRRLKQPVHIDVAFWNYEQAGGRVDVEAADGALNRALLRQALVSAYNSRYGTTVTQFDALLAQ